MVLCRSVLKSLLWSGCNTLTIQYFIADSQCTAADLCYPIIGDVMLKLINTGGNLVIINPFLHDQLHKEYCNQLTYSLADIQLVS